MAKESKFQLEIRHAFNHFYPGCLFVKLHDTVTPGIPDCYVATVDGCGWFELKQVKRRPKEMTAYLDIELTVPQISFLQRQANLTANIGSFSTVRSGVLVAGVLDHLVISVCPSSYQKRYTMGEMLCPLNWTQSIGKVDGFWDVRSLFR